MLGQLYNLIFRRNQDTGAVVFRKKWVRTSNEDFSNLLHSAHEEAGKLFPEVFMIDLTKLDGTPIFINPDLITTAESTPDTVVSLLNGVRMMIRESPDELKEKIITYRRLISEKIPAVKEQKSNDDPVTENNSKKNLRERDKDRLEKKGGE